jgi:hypothetical protein
LTDGSLALLIDTKDDGTTGFALQAGATVSLSGFGDAVSINASGTVRVNAMGREVSQTIPTGVSTSQEISFADGVSRQEVIIDSGSVTVDGVGTLSGALTLVRTQEIVQGVTITEMTIGVDQLAGSLTLGPATAALTDGRGAVLLRQEVDANGGVTNKVAVQAWRCVPVGRGGHQPASQQPVGLLQPLG